MKIVHPNRTEMKKISLAAAGNSSTVPLELSEDAERMDEDGFRVFYAVTARPLRSYIVRVSGSDGADDLLQETYLRFLRARVQEMDDTHRKNYLFRIATNLIRDRFRASRQRFEELPELAAKDAPEAKFQTRRDLGRVLERLKPRDRQILWLAYVERFSHREIAAATGLREQSVRPMLFRARRKLATLLRKRGFLAGDVSGE